MRRLIGVALLLAAACGGSPSSPSQPPASPAPAPVTFADFSGLWTAKYRITACAWERHCVLFMGTDRDFNLRLVQSGSHVRGLFVEGNAFGDVEGDVSSDGTLVLAGYNPPASARDGSFRVTEIRVRLGAAPDLQGQVSYENQVAPQDTGFGLGMKATGDIVSATRSDLTTFAATTDGVYRGRYAVRSCAAISAYCYPNEVDDLVDVTLVLARFGGAASGSYQQGGIRVPLNGTISGATIVLAGEGTTPASGGDSLTRITNWRGSLDAFGRLSGSFHLDFGFPIAHPTLGGSADCELVQLVKSAS
jgi:hypothetical protein